MNGPQIGRANATDRAGAEAASSVLVETAFVEACSAALAARSLS